MSVLAIEAGLQLIDRATIIFEAFFPANDRPEFSKAREKLIEAIRVFENTSESSPQKKARAHNQIKFCLNASLDFFENDPSSQKVFDTIFCCLYNQIAEVLEDFEYKIGMHAQKQYLLADLFNIPMDDIHGRFYEYGVTPESHYNERILNALLTRTRPNGYSEETIETMHKYYNLAKPQAIQQLERLHGYFEMTATRYNFRTDGLLTGLLDKKKRNKTVHVRNDIIAHYKKQKQLFARCNNLISNDRHTQEAAEWDFDDLVGEETRKRIQQSLHESNRGNFGGQSVAHEEIQPTFSNLLNSPKLKHMRMLFTNEEIGRLEKMFTHYCKFDIEDWFEANEEVEVRQKGMNGQQERIKPGRFLGRRIRVPVAPKSQKTNKYYLVRDEYKNDIKVEHAARHSIHRPNT